MQTIGLSLLTWVVMAEYLMVVSSTIAVYHALEEKRLHIPEETMLPGKLIFPFVIIADDGFPLKWYVMKSYGQTGLTHERQIFNYHSSCALRVVENCFGILANRFRVFMTPVHVTPEKFEIIT